MNRNNFEIDLFDSFLVLSYALLLQVCVHYDEGLPHLPDLQN